MNGEISRFHRAEPSSLLDDNDRCLTNGSSCYHHRGPECSLDEALDIVGVGRFQTRLLFLTAATQFADACELMSVSYLALPSVWCQTQWRDKGAPGGLVASSLFFGMLIGAWGAGHISDRFGRRPAVLATLALTGFAGLASAAAATLPLLLGCRVLVGVGVGGAPAALSLYAEFLPAKSRGSRLLVFLLFFSVGSLVESAAAWLALPKGGWRLLLVVSAVPSIALFAVAVFALPESPRFLLVQGRRKEAFSALLAAARTNGRDFPLCDLVLEGASNGDAHERPHEPAKTMSSEEAICRRPLRRISLVLGALFFLMAFAYYGLVLLTPAILLSASDESAADESGLCGTLTDRDFSLNMVVTSGELPGLLAAWLLVERVGRRRTVALAFAASAAATVALAVLAAAVDGGGATRQGAAVAVLFAARASALAYNQSLWVLATEAFPTSVRATGVGVATCLARVGGIAASASLPELFAQSAPTALGLCAACCAAAAALVFDLPHETSGASLADIVAKADVDRDVDAAIYTKPNERPEAHLL